MSDIDKILHCPYMFRRAVEVGPLQDNYTIRDIMAEINMQIPVKWKQDTPTVNILLYEKVI